MNSHVHYHQGHASERPILVVVTPAQMKRVHVNAKITLMNGMTILLRVCVLQITLNKVIIAVNN